MKHNTTRNGNGKGNTMSHYRVSSLHELKERQAASPTKQRSGLVNRASRLMGELRPQLNYRYADLYRKLTLRAGKGEDVMVKGEDMIHDLRLLTEDLSVRPSRTEENEEAVLTMEDLSRRFKVSTKTVERWRNRGLVGGRYQIGNRTRIGFLQSAVDRFVSEHAEEIDRGTRFSQLSDEERQHLIARAQRLAAANASPAEIIRRVARKFNRSAETVRYTLKNHDQQNPKDTILTHTTAPLSDEKKNELYERSRHGVPVERLAKQYGRTPTSIYRIINDVRMKRLLEQPIEFVYNESFEDPASEAEILGEAPEAPKKKGVRAPAGLPPYLASLYEIPLLSRKQEAYYFRKMNYLKFCAARMRDQLDVARLKSRELDRIEDLLRQAAEVKDLLIRSNLRLVVSIAKRHIKPGSDFFEMVSDGNISLMRAIDRFDYSKGFKLSTYATWAIMNNFTRTIAAEHSQHDRFRTGTDEFFQTAADRRTDHFEQVSTNQRQHAAIMNMLTGLRDREREILISRYGLKEGTEPQTLEQVGQRFGVTKERIRQLEMRALDKLRNLAATTPIDIPGI